MITGYLDGFWETGTEGVMWTIVQDGKVGYDANYYLEAGDYLEIIDTATGEPVWAGKLMPDYEIGYAPYPMNPDLGQQVALGHYVHWIQEGFLPDDWAKYFINNFQVQMESDYRWGDRFGRYRGQCFEVKNHPVQMTQDMIDFWKMIEKMKQDNEQKAKQEIQMSNEDKKEPATKMTALPEPAQEPALETDPGDHDDEHLDCDCLEYEQASEEMFDLQEEFFQRKLEIMGNYNLELSSEIDLMSRFVGFDVVDIVQLYSGVMQDTNDQPCDGCGSTDGLDFAPALADNVMSEIYETVANLVPGFSDSVVEQASKMAAEQLALQGPDKPLSNN